MSRFVGGLAQAQYVARVRDLPRDRCLVVAVDVGKRTALALIADQFGMVIGPAVPFGMDEVGVGVLTTRIAHAVGRTCAVNVRVGVETAGHYHQGLVAALRRRQFDVVELNPFQVKSARAQRGQAGIKTDERDCMAMIDLLVRGQGWPLHRGEDAMAEQLAWAAHRRRKTRAMQALGGQVHALADIAFPGVTGCFRTGLEAKTLRMLLATVPAPAVVAAMSADDLVRHAGQQGVRMLRPKARQVIAAAQVAMCVGERQRAVAATQLARDISIYRELLEELALCDRQLALVLPDTPAGVLVTIPRGQRGDRVHVRRRPG
jgi:transposase